MQSNDIIPETHVFNSQSIFDYAEKLGCSEFHIKIDPKTGLKAIIAIHNTKRGPALGGCRLLEYVSIEDAFKDAIRLARGMTYKTAVSNLPLGGGKSVLLKPKVIEDHKAYFETFGRFINSLNGRYITAMDSGTYVADMDVIATQTPYVTSTTKDGGDPSPLTALGIHRGIEAAIKFQLKKDTLKGLHIAIQGVGHVGYDLCQRLRLAGAKVTICDINENNAQACAKQFNVETVPYEAIYDIDCDVFSPCALGGILNKETIPRIKAPIIAGSANNQLATPEDGDRLQKRGILYAPDYAINAGGIIFAHAQYVQASLEEAKTNISKIYYTLLTIFERAQIEGCSPATIADEIAVERLAE